MTTVGSIGKFRDVHDINVTSINGRKFIIDIYKNESGFESEVTVIDPVSDPKGSWVYTTKPASPSSTDNFRAGIELVEKYLRCMKDEDLIHDIHNPCNCPFISEADQNITLTHMGYNNCPVRVN